MVHFRDTFTEEVLEEVREKREKVSSLSVDEFCEMHRIQLRSSHPFFYPPLHHESYSSLNMPAFLCGDFSKQLTSDEVGTDHAPSFSESAIWPLILTGSSLAIIADHRFDPQIIFPPTVLHVLSQPLVEHGESPRVVYFVSTCARVEPVVYNLRRLGEASKVTVQGISSLSSDIFTEDHRCPDIIVGTPGLLKYFQSELCEMNRISLVIIENFNYHVSIGHLEEYITSVVQKRCASDAQVVAIDNLDNVDLQFIPRFKKRESKTNYFLPEQAFAEFFGSFPFIEVRFSEQNHIIESKSTDHNSAKGEKSAIGSISVSKSGDAKSGYLKHYSKHPSRFLVLTNLVSPGFQPLALDLGLQCSTALFYRFLIQGNNEIKSLVLDVKNLDKCKRSSKASSADAASFLFACIIDFGNYNTDSALVSYRRLHGSLYNNRVVSAYFASIEDEIYGPQGAHDQSSTRHLNSINLLNGTDLFNLPYLYPHRVVRVQFKNEGRHVSASFQHEITRELEIYGKIRKVLFLKTTTDSFAQSAESGTGYVLVEYQSILSAHESIRCINGNVNTSSLIRSTLYDHQRYLRGDLSASDK